MGQVKIKLVVFMVCVLGLTDPLTGQPNPQVQPDAATAVERLKAETLADRASGKDGVAAVKMTSTPDGVRPREDGCADILTNRPDPHRQGYAACVTQAPPPNALMHKVPSAQPAMRLPDFCHRHAFDGWWATRTSACAIDSKKVVIVDLPTGRQVGEIRFMELNYSYASPHIQTWAHQVQLSPFHAWGVGVLPGTVVFGQATCRLSCLPGQSLFPRQQLAMHSDAAGEAFFDTPVFFAGMAGEAHTRWTYAFGSSLWPVPATVSSIEAPKALCGNRIGDDRRIGCAFDDSTEQQGAQGFA